MVDSTDPSTWVYDPRYDDIEKWYEAEMKGLDPDIDGTIPDKPVGPVVTGSFAAWKRSVHSPNVSLIAHAQKFWVHDAAEARVNKKGRLLVTCTCGLVVDMTTVANDVHEDDLNPGSTWSKYFAGNHGQPIEWQRTFFEHPGHRDPFHTTVLGSYLVRLREPGLDRDIFLEARCHTCGWLTLNRSLSGEWGEFDTYSHRVPLDMHNLSCPQDGTDCWDADMYLWGHGPASAWKHRQAKAAREQADAESATEPDETSRPE